MSVIHWFRKGLRLHDNQALLQALEQASSNGFELRPVFVLDPWFVKHACVGTNRWKFLHETLSALDKSLKAIGSRLFVLRGKPEEVFKEKFKEWNVKAITWEYDSEPYAKRRDAIILELADKLKVNVKTECGHTLYDSNVLVKAYKGVLPTSYQKFLTVIAKVGPPPKPAASVNIIPDACKTSDDSCCYDIPSLLELGVEKDLGALLFPGGEAEGLRRLEKHLLDKKWIRQFEKPKTSPNSLSPSTTVLSPYLKFGCLSVRTMYWRLQEVLSGGPHSQPPVSLIGQLLWREFFYTCGSCIENFDKMDGNPVCKQIDWDTNLVNLRAWRMGQTGYPFIDAIMTQLHQEGWIHHLARHAVACFLTRGDLYISWEEGQKVFEELLLDADWSLNAGNWLWLSASAFFHQYFRVYSPVAFGKKTDKNGDYIKKYIPALRKFPPAYIYEPWKAPLQLQKAAGCIIGVDYPKRIVDHETAHKRNMERMKQAYLRNQNQGLEASSSDVAGSSNAKDKKRKSQSDVEKSTLMKYVKKL